MQRGWADSRAAAFTSVTEIIAHLQQTQGSISYILENVPAVLNYPEITDALGQPVLLKAHMLGSTARRNTAIWTNAAGLHAEWQAVELAYDASSAPTVQETLNKHNFKEWQTRGDWQTILPKFVAKTNSWAFTNKGTGMLLHNGVLMEPSPDVREACMGYEVGTTSGDDISPAGLRHSVLGAAIDCNLMKWIIKKITECFK